VLNLYPRGRLHLEPRIWCSAANVVNVLDGTALLGAWDKVHLPTKIIGVGEGPNDLRDFEPDAYARQLLD